jgi:hypothetical protein
VAQGAAADKKRGGWPPRRGGQPNNGAPASHRVIADRPNLRAAHF